MWKRIALVSAAMFDIALTVILFQWQIAAGILYVLFYITLFAVIKGSGLKLVI